ncbi:MAG: tetratricopeptide repeat protein [Bacteroidetes bacterium]|nr:tetratricopeptide repeat protein [Bacteroidota bacterium]
MENNKKKEQINLISMLVIMLSVPLYLLIRVYGGNETGQEGAQYVGKESCIECHANEYNHWVGSDHDKAMDHANENTVLGNFNNQQIEYNGMTHKMYKRNGQFFVLTDGENGELQEYEIKYVFGYDPLQQYLVEFEGGRLQTLAITWNTKDSSWYHMAEAIYQDQIIEHNNWLHWTNQAQNWNSMCADCHSTNLVKGYDVQSDSYHTTYSEIDVSCEACHGPASEHIDWVSRSSYRSGKGKNDNYGLTVKTSNIDHQEYANLCVRCHSRRSSIDDFQPHADMYNHTIPNLPTNEHYHIDGQIQDEVYVYSSFTQSKMHKQGVKCNDCHDVHSTKLLFEDNRLCTQCHRADDYDTYSHHFHKYTGESGEAVIADDGVRFDVGEGTKCVNCHMPAQFYMGVDYRSDHSMRVPRPDLTKKIGTPNACNQCHADKSVDWAINYVKKWHGIGRPYQYGQAFNEAQTGSEKGFNDLVRIYQDEAYPDMVRATALHYVGNHYPVKGKAVLTEALGNSSNLIKYSALQGLRIDDQESLDIILTLLTAQAKAIRILSASKLYLLEDNLIPQKYRESLQTAKKEYEESLLFNADFPTGKFNLANYYYNTGNTSQAMRFYEKALKQDSLLHPIKVNLAIVYNARNEYKKADALFRDYLSHFPEDGSTLFSYALFLSEQKRYDESLEYLLKAARFSPDNARIIYNTAMMYDFMENYPKAENFLMKAVRIAPNNSNYYMALLNLYVKYKKTEKAQKQAQVIVNQFPEINGIEQVQALLP